VVYTTHKVREVFIGQEKAIIERRLRRIAR
jgi:hypothetical protein